VGGFLDQIEVRFFRVLRISVGQPLLGRVGQCADGVISAASLAPELRGAGSPFGQGLVPRLLGVGVVDAVQGIATGTEQVDDVMDRIAARSGGHGYPFRPGQPASPGEG
jgi:hypothetical protein